MDNYITEIVPDLDKMPDWAREAFEAGQYFTVVSEKILAYETLITTIGSALKRLHVDYQTDKEGLNDYFSGVAAGVKKTANELQAILKEQL